MKFIKKHKYTFIIAGVFIVLFIFAFIGLKNLLYPDSGKDKYGDRLDGIEEHPIKNEDIESVKSKVKESKKVNDITYSLEGRLMKFAIDVKKGTDKESIESLGETILSSLRLSCGLESIGLESLCRTPVRPIGADGIHQASVIDTCWHWLAA